MLSLPAATVRTRLARSLEKLRAILGERAAS
jgi:DNA-directed RNA polymerase specialized sigma24 family protein